MQSRTEDKLGKIPARIHIFRKKWNSRVQLAVQDEFFQSLKEKVCLVSATFVNCALIFSAHKTCLRILVPR